MLYCIVYTCERVLTLIFLRIGERSCARGYAHKYICVFIKQTKQSP